MVGSKLTLKAIFKAKKAKNRTSLEHPYFGCSNEVEILAVLTKLKSQNPKEAPPPIGPPQVS